jgi:hypothetical protein
VRPDLAIIRNLIQEIGVLGQAFFPRGRNLFFSAGAGFACALLMTACAGDLGEGFQSGRVLALGGAAGRWVGPVIPVESGCGLQMTGLMSIARGSFAFDPFQSTTVLQGNVGPTGDLVGEAVRLVTGNIPITMDFHGQVQKSDGGERILGTLASGRCHWSVALLRG